MRPWQVCHQTFKQNRHLILVRLCSFSKNTNYESIQQTAQSIAEQAHVLAYDPNYMSPFAQFACDNGLNVRGERLSLVEPKDG